MIEILGRKTLPALEILKKWAHEREGEQAQLDFVCFLDSIEERGIAREGGEEELLKTLDRPGLTVLQSYGGSSTYPRTILAVLSALFCLGLIFLRRGR